MKNSKFSENLKMALISNEISQCKLAKQLGITQQTVSRWVAGINEPDFETLLKICVILNETPNDILGFNNFTK